METVLIWSPVLFGVMIGWLSVYFIRKYKTHDANILWKTAGVFLIGVGIDSLSFILGSEIGAMCILYYMLGCAVGFFVHWIYQFFVSFISRKNGLSIKDYLLLSSCNLSEEEEIKLMEKMSKENYTEQSSQTRTTSFENSKQ